MADGPIIVPAPIQAAQTVGRRYSPAPLPYRPHPMAYLGPSGRSMIAQARQVESQQQQRQVQIRQMLMQAIQTTPDISLDKIAPPDTDLSTWQYATEIQKQIKAQQKERKTQESIPDLAMMAGRAQQESGEGPHGAMLARAIEAQLNRLGGPQTPEAQRMGQDIAAMAPIMMSRRGEMLEGEQRGVSRTINTELRARSREVIESAGMALAGGTDREFVRETLVRDGYSGSRLQKAMSEADSLALGKRTELAKTAYGITGPQAEVAGRFNQLQEETGGVVIGLDGKPRPVTMSDAQNIVSGSKGLAFFDGEAYFVSGINKPQLNRKMDAIEKSQGVLSEMDVTRGYYDKVVAKMNLPDGNPEKIRSLGPFKPSSFQDFLRFAGEQDDDYAAYTVAYFLTTADLLKAKQGSRPSDFDFKNFLAMYPLTTEFGKPAAAARMDAMKLLMREDMLAQFNPKAADRVRKLRAKQNLAADKRLDAKLDAEWEKWKKVANAHEDGKVSTDELNRATARLLDAAQDWRAKGGADAYTQGLPLMEGEVPVSRDNMDLMNLIAPGAGGP